MTSGDVDVSIMINVSALGYIVPAGSAAVLIASPGFPSVGAAEQTYTMTISPDGSTLFYNTVGNGVDFQSGGNWVVRARVLPPGGGQFTSPPGQFYVDPA